MPSFRKARQIVGIAAWNKENHTFAAARQQNAIYIPGERLLLGITHRFQGGTPKPPKCPRITIGIKDGIIAPTQARPIEFKALTFKLCSRHLQLIG